MRVKARKKTKQVWNSELELWSAYDSELPTGPVIIAQTL